MFRTLLLVLTVMAPPQLAHRLASPDAAVGNAAMESSPHERCLDARQPRAKSLRSTEGNRVFIERAKAVSAGKSILLMGYPTLVEDASRPQDAAAGGVVYLGVRLVGSAADVPIPVPERTGGYAVLRVASTPAGTIDALWRSDGPPDPLLSRDSLHSASWNGQSWSAPRTVPGFGLALSWSALRVSQATRDADGPWLRAADKIVRWTTSGWQASSVADQAELYFDVLSLGDGVNLLAYVANASPGANTVFLRRSTDHGKTWTVGQRVGPKSSAPAYEPHLVKLGTRRVALVWIDGAESLIGQTLRIALSPDAGRTWQMQPSYRLPHAARTLNVAGDRLGTIHAVVQLAADATSSFTAPYHAVWRGAWSGHWLASQAATSFGAATVDAVGPSTVVFTWSEFEAQGQTSVPVTRLIISDAACFTRIRRTS